ncbi:S-type Pyocin [Pseudomonas sp. NFIX51]|uniref:S-type pyocin domain-containing protein n=1 Tax=unclassified Pseudomonas TaxID=196821 RepID=UPI0008AC1D78|nr:MULTISPECIES: S-type pyocin domain-containing protein [unclassified Pseudomonas]SEM26744.1 DNase/tRNase domain of colicin-like bacteriocin [Pseudomonas sp. NFACC41-3]SMH60970.1 S-type Pyocin [Pseudomonas sp. NFIX51]
MSGYVANSPKGYRNKGIEPVDLGAQRWAEYKDLPAKAETQSPTAGCSFTKPCKLADGVINYASSFIPTEAVKEYGEFALLGGRETDAAGNLSLRKISGNIPAASGSFMLGANALASAGVSCGGLCRSAVGGGAVTSGVVAGSLLGVIAMLAPSSLGDSALYTEEQLKSLSAGRTRVRLHIEEQADGTLKGYGYNTEKRRDWEMIPVVRFQIRDQQQVADLGDGVTLIWTPAVDPSSTSGIPPLEAAPQAPPIWIYPPTEQADTIIVSPLYPPEYQDFILVFPPGSGVQPLYIVMNVRKTSGTASGEGEDIQGVWLIGANSGVGVPIPKEVGDALRGRDFKSFNAFRAAFWKAIAETAIVEQFVKQNISRVRSGRAPRAREIDSIGGRMSYELHHLERVSEGGGVYDIDNLRVNTPRNHIDLHRSEKG